MEVTPLVYQRNQSAILVTHLGVLARKAEVGAAEARLDEFHRGLVSGPVVGPYGETSPDLDSILDTCSTRIATKRGRFLDREPRVLKQLALQELRRDMLLTIDRGWSALIMNAIPSMTQD